MKKRQTKVTAAYRKSRAPQGSQLFGLQGLKAPQPKNDFDDISFLKGLKWALIFMIYK